MTDAVERSDELDERIGDSDVARGLAELIRYSRRSRAVIAVVAVLVLAVAWLGWRDHKAGQEQRRAQRVAVEALVQARINANNLRQTCESANRSREDQRKVWDGILALPPPPSRTPAEQRQMAEQRRQFIALLDRTFRHLDCNDAQPFK